MAINRVRCTCGNVEVSGSYEVQGRFLVITSRLGVARAAVGLQNPRKLAAKLLTNTCKKSLEKTSTNQTTFPSTAAERAVARVKKQRDKIGTMATDDPMRSHEERMLDQMIETSRIVETAAVLLPSVSEV